MYTIKSISIEFAIPDFTNPATREWMKKIISENMIKEARASGWMHDFGEYMPFDAVSLNGDPFLVHNDYPN